MTFNFDEEILFEMRKIRKQGGSVIAILEYLIENLNLDASSRLTCIMYFKEAFSLKLKDAMLIGSWEFFEGSTWNSSTLEQKVAPLLTE